jgi:hypothetical protein
MVEILNGKITGFIGEDKLYIGRTNRYYNLKDSPLANPFNIGSKFTRESSIENYKYWLFNSYKNKTAPSYKELIRLLNLYKENKNLKLVCWCAPKVCHGDIIKQFLDWMVINNINE